MIFKKYNIIGIVKLLHYFIFRNERKWVLELDRRKHLENVNKRIFLFISQTLLLLED
jgi:hypothetical protein